MSDHDRDCIRCGKKKVSIHSCAPCETYRAGMNEGVCIAISTMETELDENSIELQAIRNTLHIYLDRDEK